MFGSHGHSHNGAACKHSHGAHNLGFGDEGENTPNVPPMNPMMMAMMQQMSNNAGGGEGTLAMNPMAMMMQQAQNNPQMKEIFTKMFEKRQQMMKEFMEKGGQQNPDAVKELMAKAAEAQTILMQELKSCKSSNENNFGAKKQESKASDLLGGNLNDSGLDDLINKRNINQKLKEDEEKKIMEAIEKQDYSVLNAVKATQYGILERLKELIESGQTDPNQPDNENVYLLHWAAINNRLEIAKYLIGLGVKVDAIGGELETSALNWAARSGHIHMCILLIQNGADPNLYDVEGFSTIHVATMFGHSNVVSYLLVKGIDPDYRDKTGATPLMFAAQRVHSRDPAQLLITFNANLNAQDSKGNTPLHYTVAYNNATVMDILLNKGASLNIPNNKGQTALDLAYDRKKINAANFLKSFQEENDNLPSFLKSFSRNKQFKKFFTRLYPFFVMYYILYVIQLNGHWFLKLFFFSFLYGITYVCRQIIFDRWMTRYIPMALATAIIFWLYTTWFIYFRQIVSGSLMYILSFLTVTLLSWYNFYKSYVTDPAVLVSNKESMKTTILKLVEQNEFSLDQFCSSCIIRRPLRSKHCGECDRCVAKFDHHCPWVDNCIGANNLKYFVGFVFWTPICLLFFMDGAIAYYHETCYPSDLELYPHMTFLREVIQFFKCSSWVSYFSVIAIINLIWIGALGICHIYQTIFLAMTTNERLNYKRYKYFTDKDGNFKNPFNFGVIQNLADLLEIRFWCFRPTLINWKREYDLHDINNLRFNRKKGSSYDV